MRIPPDAALVVVDGFNIVGYVKRENNPFEYEPVYSNGVEKGRESLLLKLGLAFYRKQLGRYVARDYYVPRDVSEKLEKVNAV